MKERHRLFPLKNLFEVKFNVVIHQLQHLIPTIGGKRHFLITPKADFFDVRWQVSSNLELVA